MCSAKSSLKPTTTILHIYIESGMTPGSGIAKVSCRFCNVASDVFASVFRSKSRLSAMTIPQPRARGHGLPSRSSCRNLRRVCKASPVRSPDIINQRPTTKQLWCPVSCSEKKWGRLLVVIPGFRLPFLLEKSSISKALSTKNL